MPTRRPASELNEARFERNLAPRMYQPCWLWLGTCVTRPRADGTVYIIPFMKIVEDHESRTSWKVTRHERSVYVRRWIYEQKIGPVKPGNMVMNVCDDPYCVRPGDGHNVQVPIGTRHPPSTSKPLTMEEFLKSRKIQKERKYPVK